MAGYEISGNRKIGFFEGLSVTTKLIIANVIFFILFYILISSGILSWNEIALTPMDALSGKYLWTFLTSMFMHAGITHIIFNMISLFFVGMLLEKIIGPKRFFWFYLFAGIFSGAIFVILSGLFGYGFLGSRLFGDPSVMGVGASGAIFGLVGVLSVLIPKKRVSLIAGPLIAIILESFLGSAFPNSSIADGITFALTIYVFFAIFAMFSFNSRMYKFSIPLDMPFWIVPVIAIVPLVIIGLFVSLPIANSAHLGGIIFGLIYGFYLRKKYPKKVSLLSKYIQ